MYPWKQTSLRRATGVLVALGLVVAAGCSTAERPGRQGQEAAHELNWDAAVYYYLEALAREPDSLEYRMALTRARLKAGQDHFQRGLAFKELGRLPQAHDEFQLAIQLDPTHQFAEQELERVDKELDILARPNGEQTLEEMKAKARQAKVQPPILNPRSKEPITLTFPKPKPVKEIYQAMAKAYGFNVLFDPKLKDDKLSIELSDVTAQQALEIVMQAAGHFYKVQDEHTILIAEDNPQNRREYEDLVIKTFFLSNADVKDVDKLLRSLIEARRLATNEQLNAITLRDTADKVAIAERLIDMNDKAKAEVMIDVELIQISATKKTDIGALLSAYQTSLALDPSKVGDGSDTIFLNELSSITRSAWSITVPNILLKLIKSTSEAQTLAQPQLRSTEGEKASLVIGDRLPIPVTSFNTSNTVGSSVVPITSYQYQDVGITIEVEPRVHHNREITLKVTVEVSRKTGDVTGPNGQAQPIIGTRKINTVIRLKDGETNLLAGLYQRDENESESRVPLLSDIPLLGRLFTSKAKDRQTVDLVLTLTPHIVRFPDISEQDLAPLWVGTESRISYSGSTARVHSGRADRGPFDPRDRTDQSDQSDQGTTDQNAPTRPRGPVRPQLVRPGAEPTPEPGEEGKSLVPSGGVSGASAEPLQGTEEGSTPEEEISPSEEPDGSATDQSQIGKATTLPVILGIEPSVVSVHPGQETVVQVVVSGKAGGVRLPLVLSYDPARATLLGADAVPGVRLNSRDANAKDGWVSFDLGLDQVQEVPQVVALVHLRGETAGPVPLVFTVDGAIAADGSRLPVAVRDGALFVVDDSTGGSTSP